MHASRVIAEGYFIADPYRPLQIKSTSVHADMKYLPALLSSRFQSEADIFSARDLHLENS
jgi:hypothetical protein